MVRVSRLNSGWTFFMEDIQLSGIMISCACNVFVRMQKTGIAAIRMQIICFVRSVNAFQINMTTNISRIILSRTINYLNLQEYA